MVHVSGSTVKVYGSGFRVWEEVLTGFLGFTTVR